MAIINHNSISGINTISVGSSIVIGDNFVLNANGIENVNGINITGVITASSFVGDGSTLTGIDATALKDSDGNVKVQAEASGVVVTGVSTFSGNVNLLGTTFVGNSGSGTGAYWRLVSNQFSNYYIAGADIRAISELRIGHSSNFQRTATFDITNKRLGINTETVSHTLYVNGDSYTDGNATFASDLDVDGHTELDNVNIAGVLTATSAEFSGNVTVLGDLTYENVTSLDSIGVATARSGLRITGGGLDVVGVSTFNDHVSLGDNDRLRLGDDGDFRIYHDGTNSVVVDLAGATTGGGLYLSGSNSVIISDEVGLETLASFTKGGSAELYYADEKKIETATSGVNIVGTTTTGQLSVTGVSTFSGSVNLGDDDSINLGDSSEFRIYHTTSGNSIISETGSGSLYLDAAGLNLRNGTATGENYITCVSNGAVSLYYDNSIKLATNTNGTQFTGNIGVNVAPSPTYPLMTQAATRYQIGFNNTSADVNYPWLVHDTVSSKSALIFHFNGVGDVGRINESGELVAQSFSGSGSGITNVSQLNATEDNSTNAYVKLLFASATGSNQTVKGSGNITFNPNTGNLKLSGQVLRAARYWRYVGGAATNGHHPRCSRLILGDGTTDTTIVTFVSDNCSDSGTIPGNGSAYSYDFGSGNTASICVAKIYSSYGGGARGANYTVQYSDDNSSWTTAFSGNMSANGCGILSGSGSIC